MSLFFILVLLILFSKPSYKQVQCKGLGFQRVPYKLLYTLLCSRYLVLAKSALDSSQMNGSKKQLDNRMTPPPKVREAVNVLKDRFAAPRDVDMLEKWADR